MSPVIAAVCCFIAYFIVYRFYARFLGRRIFALDPLASTPAHDLNDVAASPRARHYLPLFERTPPPDPEAGDWAAWEALMASREMAPGQSDANAAIHVETDWGFGTVSSSFVALPDAAPDSDVRPIFRFAFAWPSRMPYEQIAPQGD